MKAIKYRSIYSGKDTMAGEEGKTAGSQNDTVIAALAYLIFFLPLLVAKDSKLAMYHANQGLLLLLFSIIINFVGGIIPVIGWFLIIPLGNLIVVVLFILGVVAALKGEEKPLPVIGGYKII